MGWGGSDTSWTLEICFGSELLMILPWILGGSQHWIRSQQHISCALLFIIFSESVKCSQSSILKVHIAKKKCLGYIRKWNQPSMKWICIFFRTDKAYSSPFLYPKHWLLRNWTLVSLMNREVTPVRIPSLITDRWPNVSMLLQDMAHRLQNEMQMTNGQSSTTWNL